MSVSATDLTAALRATLLEITAIASPIGEEKALCDHVEALLGRVLGPASVIRFRDSLVVRVREQPGAPKIALVGHLDTVRTRRMVVRWARPAGIHTDCCGGRR